MISALVVVLTAASTLAADGPARPLVKWGGDPARGLLVNHSTGARPFDAPDPSRPTVIFVHGFNPLPRVVHFGMAEELALAARSRGGPAINLLAWDWNAATFESPSPRVNLEVSVLQGRKLAGAMGHAGVDPARSHLIGHSAGAIVATSAAQVFAIGRRPVAQLTLLDPATYYHPLLFERMSAGSLSVVVENYWCPGPSAFGKETAVAGVRNYRVAGPASFAGLVFPLRSDHLFLFRWYARTVEDPSRPGGYNLGPISTGRLH